MLCTEKTGHCCFFRTITAAREQTENSVRNALKPGDFVGIVSTGMSAEETAGTGVAATVGIVVI